MAIRIYILNSIRRSRRTRRSGAPSQSQERPSSNSRSSTCVVRGQPEIVAVDLCAKLTVDPEEFSVEDVLPLRTQGFRDIEILDILNYAAFFANANRLILTLGEPALQPKVR